MNRSFAAALSRVAPPRRCGGHDAAVRAGIGAGWRKISPGRIAPQREARPAAHRPQLPGLQRRQRHALAARPPRYRRALAEGRLRASTPTHWRPKRRPSSFHACHCGAHRWTRCRRRPQDCTEPSPADSPLRGYRNTCCSFRTRSLLTALPTPSACMGSSIPSPTRRLDGVE